MALPLVVLVLAATSVHRAGAPGTVEPDMPAALSISAIGAPSTPDPTGGAPATPRLSANGPVQPAPSVHRTPQPGGRSENSVSEPGVPVGLAIPAIGLSTRVVVTETVNGEFQVPDDISVVGWDRGTVQPGAPAGTTLIAGHVDDAAGGDGALHDLPAVDVGDRVTVETPDGHIDYRIIGVDVYRKTGLPGQIVAQTGPHQIAVVTCGGPLVRGADGLLHYRDNLVVWARPR